MKQVGEMARLAGLLGPVPGNRAAGPQCPTCSDTGWAPTDTGDRQRPVRRCPACLDQRRGCAPGVPDLEAKTSLATWARGDYEVTNDNRAALVQAQYFVDDVHPGLYLHGSVGSGKTALACAILNDLHRIGVGVRFVRVTDLLKQLVQEDTGDQVLERIISVPVLCLDDLGAQKCSDYARQVLQGIYDGRTDKRRRTVWTSNLDLEELVQFMGEDKRLASRIAGSAKVVHLDGPDYRLRQARRRR